MKTCFGVFINVLLNYPQLYPGYLIPEEKQSLETLKIGLSISWILLFICIFVLVLGYILFRIDAWSDKRKSEDH